MKKELYIMRFKHNEVDFDFICEGHPNHSKMNILRCFDDHQVWLQN